jgi:DNA-binding MarR family transcriptional regulator
MGSMKDLTRNQRLALRQLAQEPRKRLRAGDITGMPPQAAGMALKGLYKRGLIKRHNPVYPQSAEYQVTAAGEKMARSKKGRVWE